MKRIVSLLIALMLLGGIALPLSARAESSGWYQVDSSSVHVSVEVLLIILR